MSFSNPMAQAMLQRQQNPFAGGASTGNQPAGLLGLASQAGSPDKYQQMALPYAQWAAGQLQQYAPETSIPQQSQFSGAQQQALAQMWDWQQRQQRNLNGILAGGNGDS